MRSVALAVLTGVLMAGCGEPPVDVTVPARAEDEHVADLAGILEEESLESQLESLRDEGMDVVALTYETEQASCGEAYRAAQRFVEEWSADVALVAVARPGDFASDDAARQRCLGVQPREERAISGDLRERIAEELVPPLAAENDWDAAFTTAAEALAQR